jgi:hypothetical protein
MTERSTRRFLPYAIVTLAFALAIPWIALGWFADDHMFVAALDHRLPTSPPWWDLYRLIPGDDHERLLRVGTLPWWAAPHLRIHFLRPLASALLAVDHLLGGDAPFVAHIHSLLWWAALLALARIAFDRWLPYPASAIALAVYALSNAHAYPLGWPSARHGLVATVFVIAALVLATRARASSRWTAWAWPPMAVMALGLGASEAALGGVAYALVYELTRARRAATASSPMVRSAGWALFGAGYLGLYAALGGGARDSGGYASPLTSPGAFLAGAATRLPVLLANGTLGIPAEFANIGAARALVVLGLGGLALVALMTQASASRFDARERDALRWLVPGALLALAPEAGGFPGARLLEVPGIGFAALLGVILRHAFARGPQFVLRRAAGGTLAALHLVLVPLATFANLSTTITMRKKTEDAAAAAKATMSAAPRAFVLSASDPMVGLYAGLTLASEPHPPNACWTWIAGARADVRIARTSAATLELEPIGRTLLVGPFEQLYRDPSLPMRVGDTASVCGGQVTVAAVDGGGRPTRIELRIDALDAPDVALLVWEAGEMRRFVPPTIGERTVVAWSAGPSGGFF